MARARMAGLSVSPYGAERARQLNYTEGNSMKQETDHLKCIEAMAAMTQRIMEQQKEIEQLRAMLTDVHLALRGFPNARK